jgi:hypothetical protein
MANATKKKAAVPKVKKPAQSTSISCWESCDPDGTKLTPLVDAVHKSADQAGNDNNLGHHKGVEDGGRGHASDQEQLADDERHGDEPVNVSNIEDLAHIAVNPGRAAQELDFDSGPTQVGAHAEVGDGSDQAQRGIEVVEKALAAGLEEGMDHEGEGREAHHRAHRKVPIATGAGDVVVGSRRIGEAIVAEHAVAHFRDGEGVLGRG